MDLLYLCLVFLLVLLLTRRLSTVAVIDAIPGPKSLPLVGNFLDHFSHRHDIMWKLIERNKKWSPIYRVWHGPLPVVYVSSPDMFETILGSTSRHLGKGYFYKFLLPWLGTGLLTSDGSKWFARRKLLTPTFHHKHVKKYLSAFHDNARVLSDKLMTKARSGEVFDVYPFVSLCTLDIICEAAMGIKINAQGHQENTYVSAIYRVLQLTKERFLRFWLFPDVFFFVTKRGREYREQVRILHGFTRELIAKRRAARQARKESLIPAEDAEIGVTRKVRAFLDLLLRQAEDSQLDDSDIREEVDTFAFEGHETTAVAISWTLLLLGMNPAVQDRVLREQDSIFGKDTDRAPTLKDIAEMKLLERVIKETSRLYPSIPLIARVPDRDLRLGEYRIPRGTTIILNIYNLHRDPEVYPDPEKFDPDRFLPERARERHPFAHVPFSAGARNCIGQKFAVLEEKVILSALLRKYRVVTQLDTNIRLVHELLLKSENGMRIMLRTREPEN